MAFGLISGLSKYNIKIPKDLSIIGYKHLGNRMYYNPILTTYKDDRCQMSVDAVCYLFEKITNTTCSNRLNIQDNWYFGETCPCGMCSKQLQEELSVLRKEEQYQQWSSFSQFEQRLTECRSINQYIDIINKFSYLIRGLNELYICLFENWFDTSSTSINTQNMICYYIKGDTNYQYFNIPITFNINTLLPIELYHNDKSGNYYFTPMIFSNRMFGYIVLEYDNPDGYDTLFRGLCNSISNALEFLRMKNDIQYLLQCQNFSQNFDTITGLYNNFGLENNFKSIISDFSLDKSLMCITFKINLLSKNIAIDNQNIRINILQEISYCLKTLVRSKGEFVGKINDFTFMFIGYRKYPHNYDTLLIDKFKSLLIHQPLFLKNYGINSITECSIITNTGNINYKTILDTSKQKLNNQNNNNINISNKKFVDIRNHIYLNPTINHNTNDISKNLLISESYFRMSYKKLFGVSFHQDCINSKISKAKYLLLNTNLDNSTIATKCSYQDSKYFLRQFQKYVGKTPSQYKKSFI